MDIWKPSITADGNKKARCLLLIRAKVFDPLTPPSSNDRPVRQPILWSNIRANQVPVVSDSDYIDTIEINDLMRLSNKPSKEVAPIWSRGNLAFFRPCNLIVLHIRLADLHMRIAKRPSHVNGLIQSIASGNLLGKLPRGQQCCEV